MVDREKVIKGLECCFGSISKACPMKCPFWVECMAKDDGSNMYSVMQAAMELLKEQPEQKHGHWKTVSDYCDDEHWQCSACGCEWYLEAGSPTENNMHYCPECGAKMDEGVKQDG